MALTSIGYQKTPGRPVEITFAAELGLPTDQQELLLIGHGASGMAASALYTATVISNVADLKAASGEVAAKFGDGSELSKMILAAVTANLGGGTFPAIKAVALASSDTDFGATDAALVAAKKVKAEYLVSPYDLQDATLRDKLKLAVIEMSGPHRVHNNQFGTLGVLANRSVTDAANLASPDTLSLVPIWLRDTGTADNAPDYSIGELAAMAAARMASNLSPFNPLDDVTINGLVAPKLSSDWITVGAGLESEVALGRGVTPLRVKPNGEVSFVRTVTARLSNDGSGTPVVTAYYDVQDFNVLFFFRKAIYTRFAQPDFKQRKASDDTGREIKSEAIRLATVFEDAGMFQAVSKLAKYFQVERNISDRHRIDLKIPVNVVPGLHVIATNIEAGTMFDVITV